MNICYCGHPDEGHGFRMSKFRCYHCSCIEYALNSHNKEEVEETKSDEWHKGFEVGYWEGKRIGIAIQKSNQDK